MIKTLSIKNYAIIEDLEIDFSRGLTIITGETGAGKSILLGALGLIMGERADLKVFFDQTAKCVVEAIFDISKYGLQEFFRENELDYDAELTVRREISPAGKSRAFVNDTPVNLDILRQISAALVDLHQQFDTLDIHQVSFQMRMLDALAGNQSRLAIYESEYRNYLEQQKRLAHLRLQSENSARESDFLAFQLEELSKANLVADEQGLLEAELSKLTHAEEIKKNLSVAFRQMTEAEQSTLGQLQDIGRTVASVKKFHAGVATAHDQLENLMLELQEVANTFGDIAEEIEYDSARIFEVQARLDLLYQLQKKHAVNSIEQLLGIQSRLEQQLAAFSDLSGEIARLEQEIDARGKHLSAQALELSAKRKAIIPDFESKIHDLLGQLAMPAVRFKIEMEDLNEIGPTGLDGVQYLFAANRGSRLQQIKDVASGGELARLTLVTKSLVASAIPLPTLIFDEIDSGVSGDVAQKMGTILRKLSNQHQVVVITHSPQVAAKADAHYFVYKKETAERTFTEVKQLSQSERIHSLAVMLSQNPPSEAALANARELIRES